MRLEAPAVIQDQIAVGPVPLATAQAADALRRADPVLRVGVVRAQLDPGERISGRTNTRVGRIRGRCGGHPRRGIDRAVVPLDEAGLIDATRRGSPWTSSRDDHARLRSAIDCGRSA
jgi:hypothetical protein